MPGERFWEARRRERMDKSLVQARARYYGYVPSYMYWPRDGDRQFAAAAREALTFRVSDGRRSKYLRR